MLAGAVLSVLIFRITKHNPFREKAMIGGACTSRHTQTDVWTDKRGPECGNERSDDAQRGTHSARVVACNQSRYNTAKKIRIEHIERKKKHVKITKKCTHNTLSGMSTITVNRRVKTHTYKSDMQQGNQRAAINGLYQPPRCIAPNLYTHATTIDTTYQHAVI